MGGEREREREKGANIVPFVHDLELRSGHGREMDCVVGFSGFTILRSYPAKCLSVCASSLQKKKEEEEEGRGGRRRETTKAKEIKTAFYLQELRSFR